MNKTAWRVELEVVIPNAERSVFLNLAPSYFSYQRYAATAYTIQTDYGVVCDLKRHDWKTIDSFFEGTLSTSGECADEHYYTRWEYPVVIPEWDTTKRFPAEEMVRHFLQTFNLSPDAITVQAVRLMRRVTNEVPPWYSHWDMVREIEDPATLQGWLKKALKKDSTERRK